MSRGHTLETPMTLEPEYGAAAGGDWRGRLRASTADRERAIDVLKAAFAEGRLTKDEYDERTGRVYGSRTYAELGALTSDLPAGPLGILPALPPPEPPAHFPGVYHGPVYPVLPPRSQVNGLAVASLICAFIPGPPSVVAVVTGLVARRQIRETGERGLAMATAGVALGGLTLLFFLMYVLFVASGPS
jgi:hypothetical protein